MEDDPYVSPTDFNLDMQRERTRIVASGSTGGPEDILSPRRVRRIYTPLRPAGVGTGCTNIAR